MNRFFDIVTLQKSLSGILLDFSGAILQILFGLILLSLYHPSFIIFGFLLISVLIVIFRVTGPRGLDSSLRESKYKYLSANWIENVARTVHAFKSNGYVNLHLEKTDYFVTNYLFARKAHFKVLLSQYWSFIIFKILITGGLLIIGCALLVNKQINIGQFVASEIIIILILNAIEKVIIKMENVYDVLTSIEKINQVTDLPIENYKGLWLENTDLSNGIKICFKNFNLYDQEKNLLLENINFCIENRETLVLRNPNRYVIYRLIDVIVRNNKNYQGNISINDVPVKNINKNSIHELIGVILSDDSIFDGSIAENISMGKPYQLNNLINILKKLGALDEINSLPDGIETALIGGNNSMANPLVKKIIIARYLLNKPNTLFIDDYFLDEIEPEKTIRTLREIIPQAAIVIVSNHAGLSSIYKTQVL
jgi:ABC-type bacteriocin/lantibiotic exporter with double-glycine peptidase domain